MIVFLIGESFFNYKGASSMFNLFSDLLNEIFSSRPVDVSINSKPLAMFNFQPKLDISFRKICKQPIKARSRMVATPKYPVYERPLAIDDGLDFSL
jgi:hypothetical protein